MDINGFEVELFNIHGIATGVKTSTCPKCSSQRKKNPKQKCANVHWDTGILHCNHCGERTQLHTYKKKMVNENFANTPPKVFKKPTGLNYLSLSDNVLNYFSTRGISSETLSKAKVSSSSEWMPKAGSKIEVICFNYYYRNELLNVKYRGKNKDFKFISDCEIFLYNLDSVTSSKECLIVEGEVDALSWIEAGYDSVISVPNGFTLPRNDGSSTINLNYIDRFFDIINSKEKIYLAFDNDVAGKEGEKEFLRRFGTEKCYLLDFNEYKDSNDVLVNESPEFLLKLKDEAKLKPLEDVVTITDLEEDLIDFWENGAPKGKTIDLADLDECYSVENKQYTLLVAAPNSGKSDVIDHISCKLSIKYGDRIGICSTENKPLKFHYDKIFKKIHGRRPVKEDIRTELVRDTINFIDNNIFHVVKKSRYYLDEVLSKFAELVKRKGCRIFILDPFNKIDIKGMSKGDVNAYTAEYHQKLDEFVSTYDCHLFLVLHPTKMNLKEGSTKTFVMPTAYNAKGGGEHFDMSYNILGLVRDHEFNLVQIRTLKVKFNHLGTSGVDCWFGWNVNNGRYTPTLEPFDPLVSTTAFHDWDNKSWLYEEKSQPFISKHKEYVEAPLPLQDPKDVFGNVGENNEDDVPF